MNGGTDDVDLMGRVYDAALKNFAEPPLIAICDKRVVAPLDRLPEMVRHETDEELPASRLPGLVAAGWIPDLRDSSTGAPGYALYAPSRVGLFLKLERDGYSPAELRVIASYEEHQIDEILTDEETPYLDDDLALLIQFAETEISLWSQGLVGVAAADRAQKNGVSERQAREAERRVAAATGALSVWRGLLNKQLSADQRESLRRKAHRVRMLYEIVRIQTLNRLRGQVITGFSPFLMFRSGEFPADWHQPAVLKGLEWRWSLETPWAWETGTPIRLPGLLLDGERVTCLRPFRPTEYDATWREFSLSEYFAVRAEMVGERVCPQCLKPIAPEAHEARRYCSDTCKATAKMRRYRRRFPPRPDLP